jgi:hypothetical protein
MLNWHLRNTAEDWTQLMNLTDLKNSMNTRLTGVVCFLLVLFFSVTTEGLAQEKDSTLAERVNQNKTYKRLMGFITREPEGDRTPIHEKSENAYLKYEGKIIRTIHIERLGFESFVLDTARVMESRIANTANKLHTNTRESVIRNNLFVREGKPLNPYRLADNERFIRNLEYSMDARIYVKPISNSNDSVDLLVVTRDVFSLGGSASARLPSRYKVRIKNVNIAGLGHRAEITQLFDTDRTPHYGYNALYRMNNIKGSFIDATVAYTKLNTGISIGNEHERSFYFYVARDLYQPFTRFAGAIELSDNVSKNVYMEPDSTFIQYHYTLQDYWLGYSFGKKRLPDNLRENRNRKFIALRAVEQQFISPDFPNLTEPDFYAYRNRAALLGQLTFFRQDFYKTQYVLGFGRTEDIPYGYRISLTAGWEKEMSNQRPYIGTEFYYNKILPKGTILTYAVNIGAFWNNRQMEDNLISSKFTRYSKIHDLGRSILRHQFEIGYSILFNQAIKRGFTIRDRDGIIGFLPDSLVGSQRLTLSQETVVFTPWKVLGFRIATVARADLALIKTTDKLFQKQNTFSGFSLGVRVRNENLIFNTIEALVFYYPTTVEGIDHFRYTIKSNFTIRYPTNLVTKPATAFR